MNLPDDFYLLCRVLGQPLFPAPLPGGQKHQQLQHLDFPKNQPVSLRTDR